MSRLGCLSAGVASANPSPNATGLQWPPTVFGFRFTCRDLSVSRTSAWTGRSLASSPTTITCLRTQCARKIPSAPRGSRGWPQGAVRVHTFVERGSASAQSADSISMVVMPILLGACGRQTGPYFSPLPFVYCQLQAVHGGPQGTAALPRPQASAPGSRQ